MHKTSLLHTKTSRLFLSVLIIIGSSVITPAKAQDSTRQKIDSIKQLMDNAQHLMDSARQMMQLAKQQMDSLQNKPEPDTEENEMLDAKEGVGKVLYGKASFYANKFHGRKTASGEIFSQNKFTCACNVLPLGTWIRVTNVNNGKSVVVKVNDRLHPKMKRIVDLTRAAAKKLDFIADGLTKVKVEVLRKRV